jgi:transposase
MHFNEISDEEWALLAPLLSDATVAHGRPGRPRVRVRVVANAVLWVLTTGEPWSRLPGTYPSAPTCRCRFEEWRSTGALAEMLKVLADAGRTFCHGADTFLEGGSSPPRRIGRQLREEGLRQVFWKTPAAWQAPGSTPVRAHTADSFTEMTRQLAGPSSAGPVRVEYHAPGNTVELSQPPASPWMGLASHGKRVLDPRGYVIYIAADPVADARFRGWAEIVEDAQRVARSGLVGPRFTSREAAQQYALEWARQWIDDESGLDRDGLDAAIIDVWQRNVRSG